MDNTEQSRNDFIKVRRNVRDSVFHAMIKEKKYLREIYLALHPEDVSVKEEDLCLIISDNIFIGEVIHDCCFTVRKERVIFIEVQSTPCRMMPYRMGCYWGNLIPKMHEEYDDRQYSPNGVEMPHTEFYMIYVGENASNVPNRIELREKNDFLNISIPVKTEYNTIGIIYEYCVFSHIYTDDMKAYGKDRVKVIRETLGECLEKGLLKEFLKEHEQEVRKIMSENNEYYFEKYLDSYGNDREEKGRVEGEAKGRAEEAKNAKVKIRNMLKKEGFSPSKIEEMLLEYSAI